jgi:hypothetical protein
MDLQRFVHDNAVGVGKHSLADAWSILRERRAQLGSTERDAT